MPADDERSSWLPGRHRQLGRRAAVEPLRPTVYTEVAAFAEWLGERGVGPTGGERFEGGGARLPARGTQGKASTYPLAVDVDGLRGRASSGVSVRLVGLNHDRPEDLDIWLVAPDGTVVTLLSDVGGGDGLDDADRSSSSTGPPGVGGFDLDAADRRRPTARPTTSARAAAPPADLDDARRRGPQRRVAAASSPTTATAPPAHLDELDARPAAESTRRYSMPCSRA